MRLREGDLCTHNRYECKVIATNEDDNKVCIAYAVFVGDERIFDQNDIKWVPESRVTLVKRDWAGVPLQRLEDSAPITAETPRHSACERTGSGSFTPTFSERRKMRESAFYHDEEEGSYRERTARRQRQKPTVKKSIRQSVISIQSFCSSSSWSSSSSSSSAFESPGKKPKRSSTRRRRIDDTPIPIVPDSYDLGEEAPGKKPKRSSTRRRRIDDTPIPIVPDSYDLEEEGEDSYEDDDSAGDSFSQEGNQLEKLACMYESRAQLDKSIKCDEVEFAWDSKREKGQAAFPWERFLFSHRGHASHCRFQSCAAKFGRYFCN